MNQERSIEWEAWKKPYQYGALVIIPTGPVRNRVNQWRKRLDPSSQEIFEAHITLTQPLCSSIDDSALRKIQEVIGSERPFEIACGPLRSFLPRPVLWLEIQPSEKLLSLRTRLHETGLFDLSLPHTDDFVPHMTITEGLSTTIVDEALFSSIEPLIEGGRFECQNVALIVPDEDFRFKPKREFSFGDE